MAFAAGGNGRGVEAEAGGGVSGGYGRRGEWRREAGDRA